MKIVNKVISISLVIALVVSLSSFTLDSSVDAQTTKTTRAQFNNQKAEGEDDLLQRLNPRLGWNFAKKMVKIGSSDKGFRLGGTPEGKKAADMVYDKFDELDLRPEYDEFNVFGYRYLDSSFTVSGSSVEIDTVSSVGTPATTEGGLTAEIVDVGNASRQEIKAMETVDPDFLDGKIALLQLDLDKHEWQSLAVNYLESKGAAGVLYYYANYYAQDASGDALNGFDWSGDEPKIPALYISKNSYNRLKDVMTDSQDPLIGTMVSDVEIDKDATGYNVIGQIEGSKYPDEFIIVNAHTDAYFQGFQDDTLAIGAMISIAEAMKYGKYKPDRTILFVSMDAEEFGNMGHYVDYQAGSWAMLSGRDYGTENHGKTKREGKSQEWAGKAVACMTIEYFGYDQLTAFDMRASESLHEFISDSSKGFTYEAYEDGLGSVLWGASEYSDEWGFAYYGIPTFRNYPGTNLEMNRTKYHTQFDNEDNASYEKYAECTTHYAKYLARLDKMAVTPYNLEPKVNNYRDAIDFNDLKALDSSEELDELTADYKAKAKTLHEQSTKIMNLYDLVKQSGKDLTAIENKLSTYNEMVRENIKLMATGTYAYEGIHNQVYEIGWHQNNNGLVDKAIEYFEKEEPLNAYRTLMQLPGAWFTQWEDEETFEISHRDMLDPSNRYQYWMEGITLQMYDHYDLIVGLSEQFAEIADNPYFGWNSDITKRWNGATYIGDGDFTDEIATCEAFKLQTSNALDEAYDEHVDLFSNLNTMFPMDQGNEIIKALESLLTDIGKSTVAKINDQTFNNKAKTPAVKVTVGGTTLKLGTDYTVEYKNNKNVGKASVVITGINKYKGTKNATFRILPKKQKIASAKSAKKKQLTVKWKKDTQVTGYQVVIGTNKKITKGKKTAIIKKNGTVKKTFKKLKKGKVYYTKIRAYKTIDGKKVYGAWSNVKRSGKIK